MPDFKPKVGEKMYAVVATNREMEDDYHVFPHIGTDPDTVLQHWFRAELVQFDEFNASLRDLDLPPAEFDDLRYNVIKFLVPEGDLEKGIQAVSLEVYEMYQVLINGRVADLGELYSVLYDFYSDLLIIIPSGE